MAAVTKAADIDRHLKAAELLADGWSTQEIADHLGVSRMTIWRYFKREDVTAYYRTLVNMRIASMSHVAIEYLRGALSNEEVPHAVRHQIARTIFERADKIEATGMRIMGDEATSDATKVPANPWAFLKKAE